MCGEELLISTARDTARGTPPRVWGRVKLRDHVNPVIRDTPTCVGKRFYVVDTSDLQWGHPHVCGEEGLATP